MSGINWKIKILAREVVKSAKKKKDTVHQVAKVEVGRIFFFNSENILAQDYIFGVKLCSQYPSAENHGDY